MPRRRGARAPRRPRDGADLIVFSELFICGYPPEDLVLKPAFQAACRGAVEALARETADGGPAVLIGTPWVEDGKLYNAVALLDGGRIAALRYKVDLPNYGVFDEKRVFAPGPMPGPINFRGVRIGVPICEDIWGPEPSSNASARPAARFCWCRTARPIGAARIDERLNIAVARVNESGLPLVYVNQVGGQDELVFDGASFVLNADLTFARAAAGVPRGGRDGHVRRAPATAGAAATGPMRRCRDRRRGRLRGLRARLRDYVDKNGFPGVVLGLSGGIDSALCAAMAVDALGPQRVRCVMLPYRFTSQDSLDDAAADRAARSASTTTSCRSRARSKASRRRSRRCSPDSKRDVTEENLQARARGTILMAVSNKFGLMVVTTGNKSEMSVGYATLYGDMNGGFNPVKDLYKTEVFRLSRLRNRWKPEGALGPAGRVIPENVIVARADRGAAREPDRPGFAAALRRARCDPRAAGRARGADRRDRRGRLRPRPRACASSACSTSPNTSAARPRPASR